MRISFKERPILDFIILLQSKGVHKFRIDDVAEYLYEHSFGPQLERPENWRPALVGTVNNLAKKVERRMCHITRISPLGPKSRARYEVRGNFERLLRTELRAQEEERKEAA